MEKLLKRFVKNLSNDEETRFEQVLKLYKDLIDGIIKKEGHCDEDALAVYITKKLDLGYNMYLALRTTLEMEAFEKSDKKTE